MLNILRALTRKLRFALAALGLALFFGLLEAAQGRVQFARFPDHLYWPEALARSLPSWLILALLSPAILTVARRFVIDGRHWRSSLPVHLIAGSAFVLLHLGGTAWVASLRGVTVFSFQQAFLNIISRYLVVDYFLYATIVAAAQIARHHSEIRHREEVEARLSADLAEARLAALRNQLNPHFLFNTLNSISALAHTGDRETLVRAVDALSGLLRVVLAESSGTTTTLASEMEFLDRYSEIQAIRFGDRLRVDRDVDVAALPALVPTLILQPLVENAVRHGVGSRSGPGWVAIRARRENQWLHLEVEDSGPGFQREGGGNGAGVGLSNTRARLDHLYGKQYEFDCRNAPDGGARVVVRIPWSSAPDLAVVEGGA